jgi:hypothetical protein
MGRNLLKVAITHPDTEGLAQDARVLSAAIKVLNDISVIAVQVPLNLVSTSIDLPESNQLVGVDVLFCLERIIIPKSLAKVPRKILIPNPEWFGHTENVRSELIGEVWHKTEQSMRIMKPLFRDSVIHHLVWWTSEDIKRDTEQDFTKFIHIRGTSHQKQTEVVLDTWLANPSYPPLLVLNYLNDVRFLNVPFTMRRENISVISRKLDRDNLITLANNYGLHLCPSTMEGFGHYINEAKSVGAVVITTDAEPMNRLVTREIGFLVPVSDVQKGRLVDRNVVDKRDLEQAVNQLLSISVQQRQILGRKARASYLEQKRIFHGALAEALFRK